MVNDRILIDREKRSHKIRQLSQLSDVVCLKANVPGLDKNTPFAKVLIAYFAKTLQNTGLSLHEKLGGFDGDCCLFLTNNGKILKKRFVRLEDRHPLGRFCDVDVTLKNANTSLSRKKLRKCFICNKPAFVCGKNNTHTHKELLNHVNKQTEIYFTALLAKVVGDSMMTELNLTDKFGLVSKTSNGSHSDLNYRLMKNAVNRIKTPLVQCFFVGLNAKNCNDMLSLLRPIGLKCEKEMYDATKGANAYKGFIFIGGVILASVGYLINKSLPYDQLQNVIRDVCKDIDSTPDKNTFGYKSYHTDGFGGIRKLASNGFDVILKESKTPNKPLLQTLCDVVGEIDDSVLLKRSLSFERYFYFKNLISSVETSNKKQVAQLNKLCVQNNISIGGSADVLIATVLLKKLNEIFYF